MHQSCTLQHRHNKNTRCDFKLDKVVDQLGMCYLVVLYFRQADYKMRICSLLLTMQFLRLFWYVNEIDIIIN